MTATKTDLHRHTADVLKPVEAGETVQVTENGKPFAEIVPVRKGISPKELARRIRALDISDESCAAMQEMLKEIRHGRAA